MIRSRLILPACLVATLMSVDAAFGAEVFRAILTNAAEAPTTPTLTNSSTGQPRPASFGTAYFVLNDAETAMTMWARIRNIDVNGSQTPTDTNDNLTNAHIHASDTVTAATSAPVVWGFHGSPDHDIAPHDEVVVPFMNSVGGVFTSKWDAGEGVAGGLAAQLNRIRTTRSYLNFHTSQNAGGEIRGFLVPIPEPSALLLMAIGGATLALRRRR
jgi:CHRD domain/PEP-CTERM motif